MPVIRILTPLLVPAVVLAGAPFALQPAAASPGTWNAARRPAVTVHKAKGRGTLQILSTNLTDTPGTYIVKGKKVARKSNRSRKFSLPAGRYRIKAKGGTVHPKKVTIRRGQLVRASITFKYRKQPANVPPRATVGTIQRISTDLNGGQSNGETRDFSWSPDGSRIVFQASASNLVPGDTNGCADVFVKTLLTGEVQRVSTTSAGEQANCGSSGEGSGVPVWSPDGTRIAFLSLADNLVSWDPNRMLDVFAKDLVTGDIEMVTTRSDAAGQYAANRDSLYPSWSPDSRQIAFMSRSDNLVAGDTNTGFGGMGCGLGFDIFVKDLATDTIQRISTDASGGQYDADSEAATWSPDGTRIAFQWCPPGMTTNGENVLVKNLATGSVQQVNTLSNGAQAPNPGYAELPAWAPDGVRIAFVSNTSTLVPNDTNMTEDVFVKNLGTGAIERVTTDTRGVQLKEGGGGFVPSWSPDGTKLAFSSSVGVVVKNLSTGELQRVDTTTAGVPAKHTKGGLPMWSPDGTRIAFLSDSTDLVPGDTNGVPDLFVKTVSP